MKDRERKEEYIFSPETGNPELRLRCSYSGPRFKRLYSIYLFIYLWFLLYNNDVCISGYTQSDDSTNNDFDMVYQKVVVWSNNR
jgi:hypothetical protein